MIPAIAWTLIPWRLLGAGALCGALWVGGCQQGRGIGQRQGAAQVAKLERMKSEQVIRLADEAAKAAHARAERYRLRAESQEAVAAQYLEQLNKVNDRADSLAAAVLAGDVRIRGLWAQCKAVPGTGPAAADPGQPQDRAELQAASLGRIDRAVSACQAQATALLTLAECDRDPNREECRP